MLKVMQNFVNKNKYIRLAGFASAFAFVVLLALSAFPIIRNINEAEAFGSYPENVDLTMVVGKETAHLDIVPSDANGSFATSSSSDVASFDVTTNNYTGYTLSISGSDDDGELINNNTSDTLDSITTATDADTFANGASSTYANKWGYQPSKLNSSANTDYLPAPTTTATVLDETSTANPTTPNNYTIALGARVDYEKPSGTYTNTYTLTAVANYVAYVITYVDTTGEASNMPTTPQAGSIGATSVAINPTYVSGNAPTRSTYTFYRWCLGTVNEYATSCTGTMYASGADLPLDPTTSNAIELKAVWDPTTFDEAYAAAGKSKHTPSGSSTSHYTMQDMSSSICAAVSNGQTTILWDKRQYIYGTTDIARYSVGKINGNCWMRGDLRIGYNSSTKAITFKASETNIPSDKTIQFYNFKDDTTHCRNPQTGDKGSAYACIIDGTDSSGGSFVYYGYTAASAGYVAADTNATADSANNSLCPKNWRLPGLAHIQTLTNYKSEFNPSYGGAFGYGRVPANIGDIGYWWGSETQSGHSENRLFFDTTTSITTISSGYYTRSIGYAIRCVAK